MHISGLWSDKKVDIHTEEVDIRDLEVDIESFFADKTVGFSGKTQSHIRQMFEKFGFDKIFGRSAVVELLGLQNSSVSKLLSKYRASIWSREGKIQVCSEIDGYWPLWGKEQE